MNLVTGGAGFIGSHLVERLLTEGEAVRVLERPGAAVDHLPHERIEVFRADIRDHGRVRAAVRGCRHVYHLAANPNLWVRDRQEFDTVNRQGTVHVLEAALEAGAERVLYTSTESILTAPAFAGGAGSTGARGTGTRSAPTAAASSAPNKPPSASPTGARRCWS